MRTVGVEEELLLVDPATGQPVAAAPSVLAAADPGRDDAHGEMVEAELQQQQIEIDSTPHDHLDDLAQDLRRRRAEVDRLAREAGVRAAALGTSPLPVRPETTPNPRYERMAGLYGPLLEEQLNCGCHVHVSVASDEEGVAVLDRIRVWLPVLVAMSSNSPFWQGHDTGYAGYRTQVWARWPSAGPAEVHGSPQAYRALVESLLATGAALDLGMLYLDARLSASYPTVEVRVPDVAQDVRHSVLLAGLVRALVDTAADEWREGRPTPEVAAVVLRGATWRASRHGLGEELVHPGTGEPAPARRVVEDLVRHVSPALQTSGDLAVVQEGVARLLTDGTAADWQRRAYRRHERLEDVVHAAVDVTCAGADPAARATG